MPVPASINDLSTTAGSNSPPGSESPATIDDYLRTHASFIAQLRDGKLAASAVSAYILTLLDDANAAAARTTLGANDASNLTAGTLDDARISNSGELTPTLINSFTNAGNTRYWKVGGIVYVAIDLSRTNTPGGSVTAFTLPVGYRPAVDLYQAGYHAQASHLSLGAMKLKVSTAGAVSVQIPGPTAAGTGYGCQGFISFPAA